MLGYYRCFQGHTTRLSGT